MFLCEFVIILVLLFGFAMKKFNFVQDGVQEDFFWYNYYCDIFKNVEVSRLCVFYFNEGVKIKKKRWLVNEQYH